MQHLLTIDGEAARTVGHQALPLGHADGLAEIGLARRAEIALAALGRIKGNDVIADLHGRYAGTDFLDDAAAFMPEYRRERAFGILPRQRESIRMAYAGRNEPYQNLTCFRPLQIDFFDRQRFTRFPSNCGSGLHEISPFVTVRVFGSDIVRIRASIVAPLR